MNNTISLSKMVVVCAIGLAVCGCASREIRSSIMPKSDKTYDLVVTASSETAAYKDADLDANEYCKQKGKQVVVISHESIYQGKQSSKTDVAMSFVSGRGKDTSSDYKVKMLFKCE